jgi:hypothetical protein
MARSSNRLQYKRKLAPEPLSSTDWRSIEDVLARYVAEAYASEHPDTHGTFRVNGKVCPPQKEGTILFGDTATKE